MSSIMLKRLIFPLLGSITTAATLTFGLPGWTLPLSPGDRVRITIPSDEILPENTPDTHRFSGVYEVNLDGNLYLPLLDPVPAAGLEPIELNQQIETALVEGGYFQPDFLQVTTSIVQWSPIQVYVSGAAFLPGRILVDEELPDEDGTISAGERAEPFTLSGSYSLGRYLTVALRLAGGIKPNADVQNVRLVRDGEEKAIDLSGIFSGEPFDDIPLIAGDQIIIPQLDTVQNDLVRPSQITPSAIAVFISNQTTPNTDGGGDIAQFTYGTRLSQAVVAARCAGGSETINANRRITLVQTDRLTGETKVFDQDVEDLLRNPNDTEVNPYLMPEDSIVCYDSDVTNVSGVLDFIGDILSPFRLIQTIFFGF